MKRIGVFLVSAAVLAPPLAASPAKDGRSARYARLPMSFEPNRGQTAGEVRFLSRGAGYNLFLTPSEAVLVLQSEGAHDATKAAVVRMRLGGAKSDARMEGLDELPGGVSYFKGPDPKAWTAKVPTYAKVSWREVYRGVDVVFYGNQRQLEYDFVVGADADPGAIRLVFDGADVRLDAEGNLVLGTGAGELTQKAPVAYQDGDEGRRPVAARFAPAGPSEVAIVLGAYDHARPLVIDPVLVYSTFLGGSATDVIQAIAVDGAGDAYVTGLTASVDFPNTFGVLGSGMDGFVTKIDAKGTTILYSTFLGGVSPRGIAVDARGDAYVTGAASAAFPSTPGAFQVAFGGGASDAFLARLDPSGGALDYATFLGGAGEDQGTGIAVSAGEEAHVTGMTRSNAFPTLNPFQPAHGGGWEDGFVARLDRAGAALIYSSFFGAEGDDAGMGIALDPHGNAYVAGYSSSDAFPRAFPQCATHGDFDAVVLKVKPAGGLVYSKCVGGRSTEFGRAIAVNAAGEAFVSGDTYSTNFPVVNPMQAANAGLYDAFVFRLQASGATFVYSSYLGGSRYDHAYGIAVDDLDYAYVSGITDSANFPVASSMQGYGGLGDAFVTKVNPAGGGVAYSTYLGGSDTDDGVLGGAFVAVFDREAYVAGSTLSTNFPLAGPLQPAHASPGFHDGFIARIQ
jgi:hypothetical protein